MSRQTSALRPVPQPIDRLGRCHRDGDDVACGFEQRNVEQCRQSATRANFCSGPLIVVGTSLISIQLELLDVELPDRRLLGFRRMALVLDCYLRLARHIGNAALQILRVSGRAKAMRISKKSKTSTIGLPPAGAEIKRGGSSLLPGRDEALQLMARPVSLWGGSISRGRVIFIHVRPRHESPHQRH